MQPEITPVPPEFQDLYGTISDSIGAFADTVAHEWDGTKSPVLWSPQDLLAISGRYKALLSPHAFKYSINPELDMFKKLGSTSVTLHINYPILYAPFYDQDGQGGKTQFDKFVAFYQSFAAEVRSRGLKLIVEAIADQGSPGAEAAEFGKYIKSQTFDQYVKGRAENAVNVARLISPDYLTVVTEPDSEALKGVAEAGTVEGSLRLLREITIAVKQAVPSMQVGGGAGSWQANFLTYIENALALPSVDFLDVHVYPVNRDYLSLLLEASDMVKTAGKRMMLSEVWSLKIRDSELGLLSQNDGFSRDPYLFWAPLDAQFLGVMCDFAQMRDLIAVCPFWSLYFFAYLNYAEYGSKPAAERILASQAASQAARVDSVVTESGEAWETLAEGGHIEAPPAPPPAPSKAPAVVTNVVARYAAGIVTLSWSAAVNAVKYRIYRGDSPTTLSILTVPSAATSYNDHFQRGKRTVYYAVVSVGGSYVPATGQFEVSAMSAPISVKIPSLHWWEGAVRMVQRWM